MSQSCDRCRKYVKLSTDDKILCQWLQVVTPLTPMVANGLSVRYLRRPTNTQHFKFVFEQRPWSQNFQPSFQIQCDIFDASTASSSKKSSFLSWTSVLWLFRRALACWKVVSINRTDRTLIIFFFCNLYFKKPFSLEQYTIYDYQNI